MSRPSRGSFGTGVAIGLVMSLPIAGLAMVIGLGFVKVTEGVVREGWTLAPAVVANRSLAPGDTISMEDLAFRSVPEQILKSSHVLPPAAAYLTAQRLKVPVESGQLIQWSFFLKPVAHGSAEEAAVRACESTLSRSRKAQPETVTSVREALAKEIP